MPQILAPNNDRMLLETALQITVGLRMPMINQAGRLAQQAADIAVSQVVGGIIKIAENEVLTIVLPAVNWRGKLHILARAQ